MADCEHLLIDGYNIIHAWPSLRKALKGGTEGVHEQLARVVRVIHDFEGVRTTMVYDGKGEEMQIERPSFQLTFSLLFTSAQVSADEVIEQMVHHAKAPEKAFVATQDHMLGETVRALGACAITPEALADWVHACERHQKDQLQRHQAQIDKAWKTRLL